jgi:hypothetical protein
MIVSYTRLVLLMLALAMGACSSTEDSGGGDGDGDNNGDGDGDGDNGDGDGDGDNGDGDGDGDNGDGDGDVADGGDNGTAVMNDVDDTDPVGDDLTLFFSPMFSAYVEGIDFFVPAIVQGVTGVRWSANPADAVYLEPDSSTGGILIKTRKAGEVQIIARAESRSGRELSGSATLTITGGTMEQWQQGADRYNNQIMFPEFDAGIDFDGGLPDGGFDAGGFEIPNDLSCRGCHGSGAEAISVEHTPQQTGGYSDEQLIRIFTMGEKPPTAKFRTGFPEGIYTRFHTWDATEEEQLGIVLYLRHLMPKSQGPLDFGGLRDVFSN